MAEEEKGFKIKDRRLFDKDGRIREEIKGEPETKAEKEEGRQKSPKEKKRIPLPPVTFSSLIMSLTSSVLMHFGEIPDPITGERKVDLDLAKQGIDTIAMLKEKTRGNLTDEEQQMIDNILTELRLRYVKAVT
jgi:hypothetical protein